MNNQTNRNPRPNSEGDRHGGRDAAPPAGNRPASLLDRPLAELLDRLVDGELTDVEYRTLLESLDSTPDGWRRCAGAFLEAQALRRVLGVGWEEGERKDRVGSIPHVKRSVDTKPGATPMGGAPGIVDGSPSSARGGRTPMLRWMAIAASWAIVFAAGWGMSGAGKQDGQGPVDKGLAIQGTAKQGASAQNGSQPHGWDQGELGEGGMESGLSPEGGEYVVDYPGSPAWIDPRLVRTEERTLPSDVVKRWRERGRDLRVREHFVPVRTNDGQGMIVPVREIKMAPVQNIAY